MLLAVSLLLATAGQAAVVPREPLVAREVDTSFPYNGPEIPFGDPVNPTLDGSKGGYPRLWEPPAVTPPPGNTVTNNINVISSALFPGGINIHFQTPFGIGCDPVIEWGESKDKLKKKSKGKTTTWVQYMIR